MGKIKDIIDRLVDGMTEILSPEPKLIPIPIRTSKGRPSGGRPARRP